MGTSLEGVASALRLVSWWKGGREEERSECLSQREAWIGLVNKARGFLTSASDTSVRRVHAGMVRTLLAKWTWRSKEVRVVTGTDPAGEVGVLG